MADPKNKWTRPAAPPAPMFFGEKERNLVKQVNDELAERVLGQTIAYYPISIEESNFNDIYGEAKEKVSLPPVRVFAYVEVENEQSNERYGYEYQTKLTVNFHRRRLVEDQDLYVRVGDFVQYGEIFYEIVKLYNDTRFLFGQVEHKFQVSAECVRARQGVFRVMPGIDRPVVKDREDSGASNPAPRSAPYPPLNATYITVASEAKLPNERVLTAGTGIEITDGGSGAGITIAATSQNARGPTGSLQFQRGAGEFTGSANLTFLTSSGFLGIGTDTPSHALTVAGAVSASSNVLIAGDLVVKGVVYGGSPLKISGSLQIKDGNKVKAEIGQLNGDGKTSMSASSFVAATLSASALVSSSFYYGDGRYLTNVTASAIEVADGPVGSLQFRFDSPIGREISGSSNVAYDTSNNRVTINSGLVHNRVPVSASHTASSANYILGVTHVPSSI